MELELGLALPDHNPMINKGLDLNSCCNNAASLDHLENDNYDYHQNPCFLDDHPEKAESKLPLLSWSGDRQQDDTDHHGSRRPKSRRLQE